MKIEEEVLFLQEDFEIFENVLLLKSNSVSTAARQHGSNCRNRQGDPWDSVPVTQSNVQVIAMSKSYEEFREVFNFAKVVTPNPNSTKVEIGRKVTVRNSKTGEERTFVVGSFLTFREYSNDGTPFYSYKSPLAASVLGAEKGEQRSFVTPLGKEIQQEVLKIE